MLATDSGGGAAPSSASIGYEYKARLEEECFNGCSLGDFRRVADWRSIYKTVAELARRYELRGRLASQPWRSDGSTLCEIARKLARIGLPDCAAHFCGVAVQVGDGRQLGEAMLLLATMQLAMGESTGQGTLEELLSMGDLTVPERRDAEEEGAGNSWGLTNVMVAEDSLRLQAAIMLAKQLLQSGLTEKAMGVVDAMTDQYGLGVQQSGAVRLWASGCIAHMCGRLGEAQDWLQVDS